MIPLFVLCDARKIFGLLTKSMDRPQASQLILLGVSTVSCSNGYYHVQTPVSSFCCQRVRLAEEDSGHGYRRVKDCRERAYILRKAIELDGGKVGGKHTMIWLNGKTLDIDSPLELTSAMQFASWVRQEALEIRASTPTFAAAILAQKN